MRRALRAIADGRDDERAAEVRRGALVVRALRAYNARCCETGALTLVRGYLKRATLPDDLVVLRCHSLGHESQIWHGFHRILDARLQATLGRARELLAVGDAVTIF